MILAVKNLGDSIHTSVVGAILHTYILFDNNSSSLKTGFSAAEDMLHKIVSIVWSSGEMHSGLFLEILVRKSKLVTGMQQGGRQPRFWRIS